MRETTRGRLLCRALVLAPLALGVWLASLPLVLALINATAGNLLQWISSDKLADVVVSQVLTWELQTNILAYFSREAGLVTIAMPVALNTLGLPVFWTMLAVLRDQGFVRELIAGSVSALLLIGLTLLVKGGYFLTLYRNQKGYSSELLSNGDMVPIPPTPDWVIQAMLVATDVLTLVNVFLFPVLWTFRQADFRQSILRSLLGPGHTVSSQV